MPHHLFSPLKIGNVTIPNRICFPGHRTNFGRKGRITEDHIAYYLRRARGGCGLIIVGEITIHPDDRPWASMIEAYHPESVEDFNRLTNAVHTYGTAVFAKLIHHGFQSSGAITRKEVWGPSAVSDIIFGETAKAMEPEDIEVVTAAFSQAASVAKEGGFDGVEIDIGQESLLRQFLSPISNHRQDDYGGSPENRMRLPLEVLQRVRREVGEDFTVGIRLCVDEKFWGGITPEESHYFAERFAHEGGAQFIEISVGTYYNLHLYMASMHTPPGFAVQTAEQLKKCVDIPVIAGHQINILPMAEEIIRNGQADAVALIRNLICDPDTPHKVLEGRDEDIRYCVRDNTCLGRVTRLKRLGCIQNPEVGSECVKQISPPIRTAMKRIMVIGGGPAGLEAARTAGERGHEVILYEKEDHIGGQINLIAKRPRRKGMEAIILYLCHMLEKLQVPVITGTEVTAELVIKENPDVVIVATGSRPTAKPVTGRYEPPEVLNVWELLSGEFPVGENILFVDENGGHHAAATAEFLADQGKRIHMITSDLFIGIGLGPIGDLYLSRQRLLQKGVTFAADLIIDEIDSGIVKGRNLYTNEPVLFQGYDTIILDMGNRADDRIYKELKGKVRELYRAGDCVAPRNIEMAILEGRKVGEMT